LKKYLIRYKPFLLFLGKFLLTYLLLTFVYESYLNQFDAKKFEVDGVTQLVAKQTKDVMLFFNFEASISSNTQEPAINLFYNKRHMARIIEGCNGLSVVILFISFVVAFSGKTRATILFVIGGSVLIHVLNVFRIALLSILLYYFPASEHILHGVFFPLFIYGVVFMLWIVWVNKFSKYATKNNKS
jgi:exosortase family protein XrtF